MSDTSGRLGGKPRRRIDVFLLLSAVEVDGPLLALFRNADKALVDDVRAVAFGSHGRATALPSARETAISLLSASGLLSRKDYDELLSNPDSNVRLQALYGLSYIGGQEALDRIWAVVGQSECSGTERAHALRLLVDLGDADTARRLEEWNSASEPLELQVVASRAAAAIRGRLLRAGRPGPATSGSTPLP